VCVNWSIMEGRNREEGIAQVNTDVRQSRGWVDGRRLRLTAGAVVQLFGDQRVEDMMDGR
jgi:hypothetical protein